MKIRPNKNQILVKEEEQIKQTDSGILIPDGTTKEKPQRGEIVAIGKMDEELDYKVGDFVIYKKWGGNEYVEDKVNYLFVSPEDILGIEQ